ncbi:MAG: TIGR01841 family phasin, partial [Pseudomonadota bacterium]
SFDAMKDITSASNPEQAQARHKEYVKSALENSVSNTKELIDLASKSSREMLEAVGSRVSDTINESLNAVKK